ncbi:hypothetical protein ONZ45_g10174 [Pleurotus djamor]|nr:hypothetical protein ONZ45_g10174 [Pleurotus djamor]
MSSTTVRKQAPRPAKPVGRYWKGKAPKGVAEADSDSDAEDDNNDDGLEPGDVDIAGDQEIGGDDEDEEDDMQLKAAVRGDAKIKAMNVTLRDVNISRDGKVIVAGREESGRTLLEESEEESEGEPQKEESEEESSEEEESSSEDEEQPKVQFRPVFVPKRNRGTIAERDALLNDTEEALKKKEQEAEERKKQSHDLVAESIRRELAEKQKEDEVPDVDDTDGLDPTAEFEAWRLRELGRIKKEKEEEVRREEERAEIERRRALPEEQRLKEDLERAEKTRAEKPKGQQKFLQKYWHKGAFHQDAEILKRHDYTEATESTVDVSLLPKVMQVKNFGKRGRTKYTHLLDQDTTAGNGGFGGSGPVKTGGTSMEGGGCFLCGGPHLKKGWCCVYSFENLGSDPFAFQIVLKTKVLCLVVDQAGLEPMPRSKTKIHGVIETTDLATVIVTAAMTALPITSSTEEIETEREEVADVGNTTTIDTRSNELDMMILIGGIRGDNLTRGRGQGQGRLRDTNESEVYLLTIVKSGED